MKSWLKKLIALAKQGYSAYRSIPEDDRKRIESNAKKISERVLKKP